MTRRPRGQGSRRTPLPKLSPGPSRLAPKAVLRNQRQRIISGAAWALADFGYADMTVAHITNHAQVSRTTFYQNFKNKQDCVLGAHKQISERFFARLTTSCRSETEWTAKISTAIVVSLAFMAEQPAEGYMLTLDSRAGNPALARRASAAQKRLAALLRSGREHFTVGPSLPDVTESALINAISGVASERLLAGEPKRLLELAPELVYMTLVPYMGPDEAMRVVARDLEAG